MPTESAVWDESYSMETTATGKQFYAVELSAASQVDVCDAATDIAIGILQNNPGAGQAAQVRKMGRSKAVAGAGTITVGNRVGTDANGAVVAKSAAADWCIGLAETASSASGTVIDVSLSGGFYYAT